MDSHDQKLSLIDERLHKAIQEHTHIPQLFEEYYPIDIAEAMETLDEEDFNQVPFILDDEQLALLLEVAEADIVKRLIALINNERTLKIFTNMSRDDIVDVMGLIGVNRRKTLLNIMTKSDSDQITRLLNYDDDTAGGIMTTEFITLKESISTGAALYKIKEIGPKTEVIDTIFITNAYSELVGTANLRDIFTADEETLLGDIMDDNVIAVLPELDQEEVAMLATKYDKSVIPVVNHRQVIIGIITYDDLMEVLIEEQGEDILAMGGVSEGETMESTIFSSVKRRLPWLIVSLFTAFISSRAVDLFSDTISQVLALASTMPIITAVGGASGSQTLSIMIRQITIGEVDLKEDAHYVVNELILGVIHGAVVGAIAGFGLGLLYSSWVLGLIIFISVILNMVLAGFTGFFIPLILDRLNLDPALASSMFVTTITDFGGFFIFLGLSTFFLAYLT